MRYELNAVQCLLCFDVIESEHIHDFKWCQCGNVAVDGGPFYLKRSFVVPEYVELSC